MSAAAPLALSPSPPASTGPRWLSYLCVVILDDIERSFWFGFCRKGPQDTEICLLLLYHMALTYTLQNDRTRLHRQQDPIYACVRQSWAVLLHWSVPSVAFRVLACQADFSAAAPLGRGPPAATQEHPRTARPVPRLQPVHRPFRNSTTGGAPVGIEPVTSGLRVWGGNH